MEEYNEIIERQYRDEPIPFGVLEPQVHWQLLNFHGNLLFKVYKRKLLNIIEGAGLPPSQETAVKRMVVDELHNFHQKYDHILGNMSQPAPTPAIMADSK